MSVGRSYVVICCRIVLLASCEEMLGRKRYLCFVAIGMRGRNTCSCKVVLVFATCEVVLSSCEVALGCCEVSVR